MSTKELRDKAIVITKVDELWNQDVIHAKSIQRFPLDSDMTKMEVGPGGEWVLMQRANGTLHVLDISSDSPIVTATKNLPDDIPLRPPIKPSMALWLAFSGGEHLALTLDRHTQPNMLEED